MQPVTQEAAFDEPAPPPGRLLAGQFAEQYGYHVRRRHGTRDWLLTFTVAGEGRYVLGDRTIVCHRGSVVVLSPGTPHDYATPKGKRPWEFFWVHFTPRAEWMDWLEWSRGKGLSTLTVTDAVEQARLRQAFTRLVRDNRDIDVFHDELADNALAEILIVLARHQVQASAQQFDPRVVQVLRRLSDDFDKDLSVAELAQSVAMSPSRLAHLFTSQTGDPIMRARMKLRMRHAARLLEVTSRQVSDIAGDVGFKSLFQFSRQFSRWYDMSPTAYRRRLRGR
jgi:AraC family transcriptional regulator of arabinose operon